MGIFWLYYMYWRWKSSKIAFEIESQNYTTGDYSILITNIPERGYKDAEAELK